MRRREVIALVGATTAAWPLGARAQHRAQVGFLHPGSAAVGSRITAVREGLAIAGGTASNAIIVPALAEGRIELLPLARGRSRCTVRRRDLCREPSGSNRCAEQRPRDRL
jgi:hypothetical protein